MKDGCQCIKSTSGLFKDLPAQMDGRHSTLRTDEIGETPIQGDVTVVVKPRAMMGLATARFDSCLFLKNDTRTADGVAGQVHKLPIRRSPVL